MSTAMPCGFTASSSGPPGERACHLRGAVLSRNFGPRHLRQRIALVSNRGRQFDIMVWAAEGSRSVVVTNSAHREMFPTWPPGGRGITFVSDRDGCSDVDTLRLDPGTR